jgi:hypothetical protein
MTASTTNSKTALPGRQVRWTRLGAGMGYTNTEPKRAAIRAAVQAMTWVDPEQLRDVLDAAPIRHYVGGLFYLRPWALHRAAVAPLPDTANPAGNLTEPARLVGLASVSGERYVLLDLGYEAIDLLHDTPAIEAVGSR